MNFDHWPWMSLVLTLECIFPWLDGHWSMVFTLNFYQRYVAFRVSNLVLWAPSFSSNFLDSLTRNSMIILKSTVISHKSLATRKKIPWSGEKESPWSIWPRNHCSVEKMAGDGGWQKWTLCKRGNHLQDWWIEFWRDATIAWRKSER